MDIPIMGHSGLCRWRLLPVELRTLLAIGARSAAAGGASIGAVARDCGVDAATVSRAVRRIEAWGGAPLLLRGRAGLLLTGGGAELSAKIAEGAGPIARAVAAARSAAFVSLAVADTVTSVPFLGSLASILARGPRSGLRLGLAASQQVVAALESGLVEAAFLARASAPDHVSLSLKPLFRSVLSVAVPSDWSLARGPARGIRASSLTGGMPLGESLACRQRPAMPDAAPAAARDAMGLVAAGAGTVILAEHQIGPLPAGVSLFPLLLDDGARAEQVVCLATVAGRKFSPGFAKLERALNARSLDPGRPRPGAT